MAFLCHIWRVNSVCLNGQLVPETEPILLASNRSFRYGDGCFETMRVHNGSIPLWKFHMERLFLSLSLLKIAATFTEQILQTSCVALINTNQCSNGRLRLSVFRTESGGAFLAETSLIEATYLQWSPDEYSVGIFPYARKSTDVFSNIKSANYLPYVMADLYAKEHQLDDCIILNHDHKLCDTTRANIFLVKDLEVFTPALHQGCVNGVMRRYTIDLIKQNGIRLHQAALTEEDLKNATEVFLTNALFGIRKVSRYQDHSYDSEFSQTLYHQISTTIFS
jgi:branched-chain amino acid aminotransferase